MPAADDVEDLLGRLLLLLLDCGRREDDVDDDDGAGLGEAVREEAGVLPSLPPAEARPFTLLCWRGLGVCSRKTVSGIHRKHRHSSTAVAVVNEPNCCCGNNKAALCFFFFF